METISKVQQKYKGTRRIERRPLRISNAKPKVNIHELPYIYRKFLGQYVNKKYRKWCGESHGEYRKFKLIYQ